MSDYLWGLLTLPIGLAVLALCVVVVKAGYLALGWLGRVGIVRLGTHHSETRYTLGAVVASAGRLLILNKGTTGVVFFTGRALPDENGHVFRLKSAMLRADKVNQPRSLDDIRNEDTP